MAANIKDELAGIELGDKRRDRRIGRLAARMAASPMESIRAACRGWAEAIAGFRLLRAASVTPNKILEVHEKATLKRAGLCRRLLLIQDTTELDYTSHKALKGAGRLDTEGRRGFYAHSRLLADGDTGVPLGLCSSHIWTRAPETKNRKHKQVPFADKESYRWFEGYLKGCFVAAEQPHAEVIVTGDRESDIYEIYAERQRRAMAGEPFAHVLIRAGRDRALLKAEEDGNQKKVRLFETAHKGRKLGTLQVVVSDKDQIRKIKGSSRVTHCIIHGRTSGKDPPTLAEMVDMVGRSGGHMGRKNDRPPGPECLWRGLMKLQYYVEMGQALGAF